MSHLYKPLSFPFPNEEEWTPRVLLIDDEPGSVLSLMALLNNFSVKPTYAPDLEAAMEYFGPGFDLIIMDWIFPECEGDQILKEIASCGLEALPPVVIHTGLDPHHLEVPPHLVYLIEGFWKKPMSLHKASAELSRILYMGGQDEIF